MRHSMSFTIDFGRFLVLKFWTCCACWMLASVFWTYCRYPPIPRTQCLCSLRLRVKIGGGGKFPNLEVRSTSSQWIISGDSSVHWVIPSHIIPNIYIYIPKKYDRIYIIDLIIQNNWYILYRLNSMYSNPQRYILLTLRIVRFPQAKL